MKTHKFPILRQSEGLLHRFLGQVAAGQGPLRAAGRRSRQLPALQERERTFTRLRRHAVRHFR